MNIFYDYQLIQKIHKETLVLDTNILSSFFLDKQYFQTFMGVFAQNELLIDPIVKFEFLRGAFKVNIYEEQKKFLEYGKFTHMIDNYELQKKINENAFTIARIYSHQGNPNIPLGDIFIISRLAIYNYTVLFLTRDYSDFDTVLFDRIGVISIERKLRNKLGPEEIIEHIQILQFDHNKYKKCLRNLPE